MLDFIVSNILSFVEGLQQTSYLLAFFAALAETTLGIGMLIPGSSFILILGILSASGSINVWTLVFFAWLGAFLGDNFNYYLGEKYGSKWTKDGVWIITPEIIKKSKTFFDKHGWKSVFLGRFAPTAKEIIPFIAGTVGMKYSIFIFWNTLGAIGWAMEWVFAGYLFAQSIELAKEWLSKTGFAMLFLFILFIVFYILKTLAIKKGGDLWKLLKKEIAVVYKRISNTSFIKKINNKYPRASDFIKKRFTTNSFFGLPLTTLFIALIYVILLIAGSMQDIIKSEIITIADTRVAEFIPLLHTEALTHFFWLITLLGKSKIIILFLAGTISIFLIQNKKNYIIPLVTGVVGSASFAYITKIIFHRTRPETAMYLEHSYSFPSGHATMSVAFYGFLGYFFIRNIKRWNTKVNVFFATLLLILLIGISRLYLGVHYLSDIWAGYLIGLMWLIIAIILSEWSLNKKEDKIKKIFYKILNFVKIKKENKYISVTTAAIITFMFLGYAHYATTHPLPNGVLEKKDQTNKIQIPISKLSEKITTHTETVIAKPAQPINLIILAKDDKDIAEIFENANWVTPDELSIPSFLHFLKTKIINNKYEKTPVSPSFYNGKTNQFAFEKINKKDTSNVRHFTRIWKTNFKTKDNLDIFTGTISADDGMKWLFVHTMNPKIDNARKYLANDLLLKNKNIEIKEIQLINPEIGKNFSGDTFFTDGKAIIIIIH